MSTVNKVILIGHTGDEVKLHHFEGGGCIGRVPLATNESYTNKQTGEKVTSTDWHTCVLRNKQAEIANQYLKKGDKVYFEGRIKNRKWQDEAGNDRYSTEIHIGSMKFLTSRGEGTQANAQKPQTNQPQQSPSGEEPDDLPF